MSSKRPGESILDYFTKKAKNGALLPSTEGPASTVLIRLSTDSNNQSSELCSSSQQSSHIQTTSLSDLNSLPADFYEYESQPTSLQISGNLPDIDRSKLPSEPAGSSMTDRVVPKVSLLSICEFSCCNSLSPYHPAMDSELALTTKLVLFW